MPAMTSRRAFVAGGIVLGLSRPLRLEAPLFPTVTAGTTPAAAGRKLSLPPRAPDAPAASDLLVELQGASLEDIEQRLFDEVISGNIPSFIRRLTPVTIPPIGAREPAATFWATPDYLAVGDDDDWLRLPLTPVTAQRIARSLDAVLPTPEMVDAIYAAADLRLAPSGLGAPRLPWLEQLPEHERQIRAMLPAGRYPRGALIAGHKKDVVITPPLRTSPGRVAIYGFHAAPHEPVQPLSLIHIALYVDYSHGVRLIANRASRDGETGHLPHWLSHSDVCAPFSRVGPIDWPAYPIDFASARAAIAANPPWEVDRPLQSSR